MIKVYNIKKELSNLCIGYKIEDYIKENKPLNEKYDCQYECENDKLPIEFKDTQNYLDEITNYLMLKCKDYKGRWIEERSIIELDGIQYFKTKDGWKEVE